MSDLATTAHGTIRYWAAAREAAGCAEESYDAVTLGEALDAARAGRDQRFADVLRRCAFIVDGDPVGARSHAALMLRAGGIVEVLPPFAGG